MIILRRMLTMFLYLSAEGNAEATSDVFWDLWPRVAQLVKGNAPYFLNPRQGRPSAREHALEGAVTAPE